MFEELKPLMKLAGPVILAEVGWMSMALVDTIMVGPLGPAAISATGMGGSVFAAIVIFGMGLMLGLDAFVSQAHGAGNERECLLWLHQGVWLACCVAPFAMGFTWLAYSTLDLWGLHPETRRLVGPYLRVIAISSLPLLVYAAFRRYLQGMHLVRPIMFALITANIVNAAGNWVLIYGNLGMPALGVEGSAWATTAARVYMAAFLYVAIRLHHRRRGHRHPRVDLAPDPARIRRLIALGFPAASQVALEVGVFAVATALAGRLDPVSSGAHQIALNIASLAFMVPLGLASSAAVRVGYAFGAGDRRRAARAGWTAMASGAVIMTAIGLVFFLWPVPLMRIFTTDPRIVDIGVAAPGHCRGVSTVRRNPGGSHGCTSWHLGDSHADDRQLHRPLVSWTTGQLCALLSTRVGRDGSLDRTLCRPDRRGHRAYAGVVEEDSCARLESRTFTGEW